MVIYYYKFINIVIEKFTEFYIERSICNNNNNRHCIRIIGI